MNSNHKLDRFDRTTPIEASRYIPLCKPRVQPRMDANKREFKSATRRRPTHSLHVHSRERANPLRGSADVTVHWLRAPASGFASANCDSSTRWRSQPRSAPAFQDCSMSGHSRLFASIRGKNQARLFRRLREAPRWKIVCKDFSCRFVGPAGRGRAIDHRGPGGFRPHTNKPRFPHRRFS